MINLPIAHIHMRGHDKFTNNTYTHEGHDQFTDDTYTHERDHDQFTYDTLEGP